MKIPRFIVAGAHSGCGKTAIAAGILRALVRRGITAQPYKIGPHLTDPLYLTHAAGRPCRAFDGWILPRPALAEVFARGAEGADVAVIEGMRGLYDGAGETGDEGSTAEVARWLSAPVVLVVDVSSSARSAAASALGFTIFDPQLTVAGVIANRAGGPRHVEALRAALAASGIALLGAVPTNPDVAIAERSVGLLAPDDTVMDALADAVADHVDLDALLRIARTAPPVVVEGAAVFPPMPLPPTVRIAVARDEAFGGYFQDALELLEAYGAQLVDFSPLHDRHPPEADGFYLGPGRPEGFGAALSANASMRGGLAAAIRAGRPVYAEGAGMLYLTERLADAAGAVHPMVGVVPGLARAHRHPSAAGYVTLEALEDSLLLRTGETVRGHEFHTATVEPGADIRFAYRSVDGGVAEGRDGILLPRGVAGSAQVHLAAHPAMAQRFIEACREAR